MASSSTANKGPSSSSSTMRPSHRRHVSALAVPAKAKLAGSSDNMDHYSVSRFSKSNTAISSSSSHQSFLQSPQRTAKTASRIMTSVRRSLSTSTKKRPVEYPAPGMYSTPEESNPFPTRRRAGDPSISPPTIEQIAMGLHISRTPHLRPGTSPHPHPHPPRNASSSSQESATLAPRLHHPPPPSRSSMKKTGLAPMDPGLSTGSSTTVASNTPSTPHSNNSMLSIRERMSRFLPGRSSSAPSSVASSPMTSPRPSTTEIPQKKAVRFTNNDEA